LLCTTTKEDDMTERISTTRQIMRYHLGRMWCERENPYTRDAVRDNLRGQRAVRANETRVQHRMVTVEVGAWQ
jgi:hypothetical protein